METARQSMECVDSIYNTATVGHCTLEPSFAWMVVPGPCYIVACLDSDQSEIFQGSGINR